MNSEKRKMLTDTMAATVVAAVVAGAQATSVALATAAYSVTDRNWAKRTLTLTNNEFVTSSSVSFTGYPAELGTPLFWLDASDTNGWEIVTEASGVKRITKIPSKTGDGRYLFYKSGIVTNGPTLRENDPELCGGRTVDFGVFKSQLGLWFNDNGLGTNALDNVGSVAALWGSQCGGGWLLGGGYGWNEASVTSPYYDAGFLCHRGANPYAVTDDGVATFANPIVRVPGLHAIVYGSAWLDGVAIVPNGVGFSANYQTLTYVFTNNHANTYGVGINDSRGGRTGGQRISEMLFYDHLLTNAERQKLDAYLAWKWFQRKYDGFNGNESVAKIQEKTTDFNLKVNMGADVPERETLATAQIVGGRHGNTFTKNGKGTLRVDMAGGYAGDFLLNAGTVQVEKRSPLSCALPTNSLIHLDASVASTLTVAQENGTNFVTQWKDVEGRSFLEKPLLAYALADYARPCLLTNALNGMPVLDFGPFTASSTTSGQYMKFTNSLPGAATVLWVVGAQNGGGSLLGCVALQRHGSGGYGYSYSAPFFEQGWRLSADMPNSYYTNGLTLIDGVKVDEAQGFPTRGYHVIARRSPVTDSVYYLAARSDGAYRGGQRLAELVIYNRVLTDRELEDAQAYLMNKWFSTSMPGYSDAETADIQTLNVADGCSGTVDAKSPVYLGTLAGSGILHKTGSGKMLVQRTSSFSGKVYLEEGTIGVKEPTVEQSTPAAAPVFHLDATAPESFVFSPQNGTNFISSWCDAGGGKNVAARYDSTTGRPLPWLNTEDTLNGHPVVDFGVLGSCRCLIFDQPINSIRSVFLVVGSQNGGGFLLGSAGKYGNNFDFHREINVYTDNSPAKAIFHVNDYAVYKSEIYTNGVAVAYTNGLSGAYDLLEVYTPWPAHASGLACDRYGGSLNVGSTNDISVYRSGGQRLGEVLLYDRVLTARERIATRNYLMAKWFGKDPQPLPEESASLSLGDMTASDGTGIDAQRPLTMGALQGTGVVSVTGGAYVSMSDVSSLTGKLSVASGTVSLSALPGLDAPAEIITDGLAFWADATWGVGLTNGSSVLAWTNRMQNGWVAYARESLPSYVPFGLNQLPIVDLGTVGNRQTLRFRDENGDYAHLSGIKSIFWVLGSQNGGGFVLGGGTNYASSFQHYNFHRGQNDAWTIAGHITKDCYIISFNADPVVKAGTWHKNGFLIDAMAEPLSGGYDLLSLIINDGYTDAEGFAFDGRDPFTDRSGGQKLAEVLIYTNALSEVQRLQVENYLNKKWGLHVYQENVESKAEIELAAGASLSLGGITQNVASVTGNGTVSNGVLRTQAEIGAGGDAIGALAVNADLVLADGNVWTIDVAEKSADFINVGGTVTFGNNMKVVLRGVEAIKGKLGAGYQQKVMTATAFTNPAALASAKCTGVPKGYSARLVINGSDVILRISRNGFVVMLM